MTTVPDHRAPWRRAIGDVVFGLETPAARGYDIALIWLILLSVIAVMLESVPSITGPWRVALRGAEWFFTVLFTADYLLRLLSARRPLRYATSFYGVVDLLAVLPAYLALILTGGQYLLVLRALRLLRMFRVFKLLRYVNDANLIGLALQESRAKLTVFAFSMLTLLSILGTVVYLVESPESGFTSIPMSIYWATVTLTTVGYGDIIPETALGKFIATLAMLTGYAIIAVPTGIVTANLARAQQQYDEQHACPRCGLRGHPQEARFCKRCGTGLTAEG